MPAPGRAAQSSSVASPVARASSSRPRPRSAIRARHHGARLTLRTRYRGGTLEGRVLAEEADGPLVPRRLAAARWE